MKKFIPSIILIIIILLTSSIDTSYAQNNKVDCEKAVTQMDMNFCAKQGYEKSEKELNKIYTKLLKVIEEKQKFYEPENQLTGKNLITLFKHSQNIWEEYKNSAAGFNGSIYQGGSMQPLIYFNVMARITEERIKELKDLLEELSM